MLKIVQMATNYTFNAERLIKQALKKQKPKIRKAQARLLSTILANSPFRSGLYKSQTKGLPLIQEKNSITAVIENSGEYGERVEFGFGPGGRIGGRRSAVTWTTQSGAKFTGKGAFVFNRSLEENRDFINKLFRNG